MYNRTSPETVGQAQGGMSPEDDDSGIGCMGYVMQAGSLLLFVLFFPFSLCMTLKVVQEYERAVIFRVGRIVSGEGGKGPGIIFVLPCIDEVRLFDLRTHSYDIKPQQVLTRDSMSITVDAVVFSRVAKLTRTIMQLTDPHHSTRMLATTTLRKFVGKKTLYELLSDRRILSVHMQNVLDRASGKWGMKVENVSLKSIYLPPDMQRSMATEAETERRAKARVIAAEGEMQASKALKEAASIISQSEAGVQLRSLETMRSISRTNSHTVVLPLPPKLLESFLMRKKRGGGGGSRTQQMTAHA